MHGPADRRLLAREDGRDAEGARGRARRRRVAARLTARSRRSHRDDHDLRRRAIPRRRSPPRQPLQVPGAICAYHAHPGRALGLQGDLPVRRRRRRGLARRARSRHQQARRRADRRAPHHRRLRAAAAGRRRHRLRRVGVQHRAHGQVADQGRRRRRCTSRTRSAPSAAAIGPARSSCRRTRWSTGSRRPSTRGPIPTSSSWRAPTRWRSKAWRRRSTARCACVEAGADMIFPEAITELAMYRRFAAAVKVPILANITEFGATPLFTRRRAAQRRRRDRALPAVRVPRDEQGRARASTRRCAATARRRRSSTRCRRARSSTTTSAITRTKQKLDELFAARR